jgi:hypothetical protein
MRINHYLAATLLFATACGKSDSSPSATVKAPGTGATTGVPLNTFPSCHCEGDSAEYIKGVFNGSKLCFTGTYRDNDFGNIRFYTPGRQDQINLIRSSDNPSLSCQFYIINSGIQAQRLPYTLPHPNLAYCEHAEITLLDLSQSWASQCQGCDSDDANYFGSSWDKLTLTITDTTDHFLRGTFSGNASTQTGKKMTVDKGEFSIRISQKNMLAGN